MTGVAPSAARLRVLHVHGSTEAAAAGRLARYEEQLGWAPQLCPAGALRRLRVQLATGPDVVVLHGKWAGFVGRLVIRGSLATVLLPAPRSWCAGIGLATWGAVVWERWAARWASAVVLVDGADAATGVRRRVWVPPFIVGDSPELTTAVLSRSYAFGRPSAGLGLDGRGPVEHGR